MEPYWPAPFVQLGARAAVLRSLSSSLAKRSRKKLFVEARSFLYHLSKLVPFVFTVMSLEDADAGNSATSRNDLKALLREVLAEDPSLLQPAADNSGGRGPNQGKYLGNYIRTRPEKSLT